MTLSMMADSMRKKSEVALLGISSGKNNIIMQYCHHKTHVFEQSSTRALLAERQDAHAVLALLPGVAAARVRRGHRVAGVVAGVQGVVARSQLGRKYSSCTAVSHLCMEYSSSRSEIIVDSRLTSMMAASIAPLLMLIAC
jgi:hypothetical protein